MRKCGDEIKLLLWHDGDHSVGISGENAEVVMYYVDEEMLKATIEVLVDAFTKIWDFRAHCIIDGEDNE